MGSNPIGRAVNKVNEADEASQLLGLRWDLKVGALREFDPPARRKKASAARPGLKAIFVRKLTEGKSHRPRIIRDNEYFKKDGFEWCPVE